MMRALVLLALASFGAVAQAEDIFTYVALDETKTEVIHYRVRYQADIVSDSAGNARLTYFRTHQILGCATGPEPFTYVDEAGEAGVQPAQWQPLLEKLRATPLRKFNPRRVRYADYHIEFDGRYHPMSGSLRTPAQAELHALILRFVEQVIPERQMKFQRRVIEVDSAPARAVSAAELLKNPARYYGKRIAVTGYFPAPGANVYLYATKDDAAAELTSRQIEIGAPSTLAAPSKDARDFARNTFVTVTGTLQPKRLGFFAPKIERTTDVKKTPR
jgi:hypothetical protein